jgi:lysylphosphatidylglycerol synthetase-like protein (DUF2156 family)
MSVLIWVLLGLYLVGGIMWAFYWVLEWDSYRNPWFWHREWSEEKTHAARQVVRTPLWFIPFAALIASVVAEFRADAKKGIKREQER